jgi:hypothetical protein
MSSLLGLDSSFVRSALVDSSSSTLSHDKRKWRSPVWAYCCRPTLDEDQTHLYCLRCPQDPTDDNYIEEPEHGKHAENMKHHLRRRHGIVVEKAESQSQVEVNYQLKQLYYQAEATGDTKELDAEILKAALNKAVIVTDSVNSGPVMHQ